MRSRKLLPSLEMVSTWVWMSTYMHKYKTCACVCVVCVCVCVCVCVSCVCCVCVSQCVCVWKERKGTEKSKWKLVILHTSTIPFLRNINSLLSIGIACKFSVCQPRACNNKLPAPPIAVNYPIARGTLPFMAINLGSNYKDIHSLLQPIKRIRRWRGKRLLFLVSSLTFVVFSPSWRSVPPSVF